MSHRAIFGKKNILVAGGAGFIGSHLCEELIKNAKVICLDNFSTGDERNIDHLLSNPDFEFVRHDITEPLELESLPELEKFRIKFQGVQEIYNLACPVSPKNFAENKLAMLIANSYGTKNLLDLAIKHGAKFIQFSSSVVYGQSRGSGEKISEDDLGQVDAVSSRSSHEEGKRFSETLVANYREIHGLDTKIIRVFRTYGPRMRLNDGHMIPDFIVNALDGKDLVIHGGEDFASSFCYVSDLVDGVIKIAESGMNVPVNLGSEIEVKFREVAEKIIKALDSGSKITYDDSIKYLTPACLPDTSRARQEFGWLPVVTLNKGIEKTIDDLRASKGLLRAG
ncbi:MAG: NAD-dependent epimerase/dehydratase family protein [Patescibacteria group bacterium]|jgi:UDP-glucuronate decarboxylase